MEHEGFFHDPRTYIGLAFFIFYGIFGRKLWGVVTGMLDKRGATVRAELDEASRLRTEAEAMLKDATAQREQAAKESQAMLAQAREEAARLGETARADAADAAKRREKMAMDRIAAAEKAAVTEVQTAAADVATRAAERVLAESFGPEADAGLIDRAIQGLPSALAGRRAA